MPAIAKGKYRPAGSAREFGRNEDHICIRFGKRLRQLRVSHHLTQHDIAHYLQTDRTYISDLERGIRNPTLATMELFALVFDVSLSLLLKDL